MRLKKAERRRSYRRPRVASRQVRFVGATVSSGIGVAIGGDEYGPFRDAPKRES